MTSSALPSPAPEEVPPVEDPFAEHPLTQAAMAATRATVPSRPIPNPMNALDLAYIIPPCVAGLAGAPGIRVRSLPHD